ncbi:vWA domain-containing protein [Herpetosiphon llansteffanensis]|uniref:vWA domain-containing protein n=1 Tax=Herpetosiphon llansteffanensis TaxID=2094568 RepID=UPI000D7CD88D|nr:VWA domain-containing protein [Herpetosiphon llansteffanensis]
MTEPVALSAVWSREPLPSGTSQVNYVLIQAKPEHVPTVQAAPPLNFCLVLDRSGSMAGDKIQHLREAVREIVANLRPIDAVSIVLFDDTLEVLVPARLADDVPALQNAIESISEQGGTAMSLGLQAGLAELQKFQAADRVGRVLLLTDGQTWGDEDTCRNLAKQIGDLGVSITALGLGTEWNEALLDDLAAASNGESDYIADPSQIGKYFQQTLHSAQTTTVVNARLLLRLLPGVTPRAVYRVQPSISNLGYKPIGEREVTVSIGEIAGDGASVLVDLMLPEREAGTFRIAQAELQYDAPVLGIKEAKLKIDIPLSFSVDPKASVVNPPIMNTVEKVTAFKLQTRALSEAEAGNIGSATQKLRAAATRLLDLGETELAQTMEQSAQQLEAGGQIDAADQKALRYATRKLTQKLED